MSEVVSKVTDTTSFIYFNVSSMNLAKSRLSFHNPL